MAALGPAIAATTGSPPTDEEPSPQYGHRIVPVRWAFLIISLASIGLYLRPVFNLGFYYDDWTLQAAFRDAMSDSWGDLFSACRAIEPAGRPGGCIYHASVYTVLGGHPAAYHVLSIVLLAVSTLLIYLVVRRCRMPDTAALLVCVLYVLYPGADSTRLWPTAIGAQYIIGAYIGGVLLGIEAIRVQGRWRLALHAGSVGLFVLLGFTYEVVLPLMAVTLAFYWLATTNRRAALTRGGCDVALACGFVVYRLFLAPVDPSSGFVEARTTWAWFQRLRVLLGGGWRSWHTLFVPGRAGILLAVAAALVVVVAAMDARTRRHMTGWFGVAAAAAVFAIVALVPFLPANDAYVPDPSSLFNRLNVAAAIAYCVLFVALAALIRSALRRWLPAHLASAAVGAMILGTAVHQIDFAFASQDAYATSWKEQRAAITGIRRAARQLPGDASVMTFGHPIWERGFIPVFAAGWDLRGAIDVVTDVDPPQAVPFVNTASCGTEGIVESGVELIAYQGSSPLWFVNTRTAEARRIASLPACERAIADWGRPPFWGSTVLGSR